MPQFAANLSMMFQELPFLERFAAAAQLSFRAVEFLFPYDHAAADIAQQLRQYKLKQALFNLPPGDWAKGERGLSILPGREREFEAALGKAIEYARALACEQVHVMAGIVPTGAARAECEAAYVANLKLAAAELKHHGIRALIEPINSRDIPGYFLNTTDHARRVIDAVGSDNLFLQLDLYHRQIVQGDLAQAIRTNLDITRHMQIAGVPGRHEPDVGEINHAYLFDLIDELGYDGVIGCEYRPKGETRAGLGWAKRYGIG